MASLAISGLGLREGKKMRSSGNYLRRLSKAVTPGASYRLFLPTYVGADGKANIAAAAAIGRNIDFEIFGQGFMTYKEEWLEGTNTGSGYKDLTGVDVPARISRIIFEAQCAKEKDEAEVNAKRLAEANGGNLNIEALALQKAKIEEKYHGRKGGDGVQGTLPTVSPAIKGLSTQIIVEMLLVPMDSGTNTPKWDAAECVYKTVSTTLIDTLLALLDNPMYYDASRRYLEVNFTYGSMGQTAKQAGQAAQYNGVTPTMGLETMFADQWQKLGIEKFNTLYDGAVVELESLKGLTYTTMEEDTDPAYKKYVEIMTKIGESILGHAGYVAGRITPQDIKAKLNQWVAQNVNILLYIDPANPATINGAADMVASGLLDNVSSVKEKLQKVAEENGSVAETTPVASTAPTQTTPVTQTAPTQTVQTAPTTPTQTTPVTPTQAPAEEVAFEEASAISPSDYMNGSVDMRTSADLPNVVDEDDDELGDI
jgi:hypothetical protein